MPAHPNNRTGLQHGCAWNYGPFGLGLAYTQPEQLYSGPSADVEARAQVKAALMEMDLEVRRRMEKARADSARYRRRHHPN